MHQFEALWDKYDAAALVCVDGVDNTDDVGCCRDDQGADNGVDEIGGNRVDCKEDEKKKNDGKEEEEGGDAMSTSVHVTSRSVSSGGGHIDGKMIRGWNDKVFRDDNLLRLVRMRRQGQGQGQRQGQGQGQGQRQGQGQGQGPGQGQGKVSSGTGDGSGTIDIGSNDRRNDDDRGGGLGSSSNGGGGGCGGSSSNCGSGVGVGGSSSNSTSSSGSDGGVSRRSAAVRRLFYLSDDVLEISYRDLVRETVVWCIALPFTLSLEMMYIALPFTLSISLMHSCCFCFFTCYLFDMPVYILLLIIIIIIIIINIIIISSSSHHHHCQRMVPGFRPSVQCV